LLVVTRYQRLAAQLFDALRVSSLEEVMPEITRRLEGGGGADGRPPLRMR